MPSDNTLLLPLLLLASSALLALLFSRFKRLSPKAMGWMLAFFPLVGAAIIAWLILPIDAGRTITFTIPWIPSLNLSFSLYLDGLSALFAILITGIGTLILVYSAYYFKGEAGTWRFYCYLQLFMTAMLGLVLAGDLITLFIFWEITSVTSFLLVAYKYKDESARRGAFRALLITAGGGIALLVGILLIGSVTGGVDYATILSNGNTLRDSALYPAILLLVALGAFTKSAQFPFHVWLPGAMSAPTPASAFLHSATMVKAGVYLLARLNPSLGNTELWFWLLSGVGLWTMLTGAYLGFKQNDLKALLAYSTISQLGVFIAMIGQDISIAFKALVIGVLAHALYKSALFMVVGIVDHETGTRDLRKLGGLWRAMPLTFSIATIAALSMAGLPPLFGFLAKETLLAAAVHPEAPLILNIIFPAMIVVAGAFLIGQAGLLVYGTFLGKPADPTIPPQAHDPPLWMYLAPAIPALLSLALGVLPEPGYEALLLAEAATAAFGEKVKVSLALWSGLNVELGLSILAIGLGTTIFLYRQRLLSFMRVFIPNLSLNGIYSAGSHAIDSIAALTTRLQKGQLRFYLVIILTATGVLILIFRALPPGMLSGQLSEPFYFNDPLMILRLFVLVLAVISSLISVFMVRDLQAILALGLSGLAVAVWYALEPAPDVALVQITVDLLATVILVLSLARLPQALRQKASEFTFLQSRPSLLRDALIAAGSGLVMSVLVLSALSSRPRVSETALFYQVNAKPFTGARDIVGAILVDFRGFDTFFEIIVFACAGLGIYLLLHYASRKAGDKPEPGAATDLPESGPTMGVGGYPTSPLLHLLAYVLLPLSILLGFIQAIYGHDQPGDGFTAAIFISLAIGFWYVVFGYKATRRQLPWLNPAPLIGGGMLLALVNGLISTAFGDGLLSPVNYGRLLKLPLPKGFYFSSSFIFELAICLVVLGSTIYILDNLGRPQEPDSESDELMRTIDKEPYK